MTVSVSDIERDALEHKVFAWDLETESLTGDPSDAKRPRYAKITHIAVATVNHKACWNVSEETLAMLVRLLTNKDLVEFVFNCAYDHQVMHYREHLDHREIKSKTMDLMLLVKLLDEEDKANLKYSVQKYCNIKMTTFEDVIKKSKHARKLERIKAKHAELDKYLKQWHAKTPKRPWPTFDGPPLSRTAIRKIIREENPDMKAKEAQEIVEATLDEKYYKEYEDWVERAKSKDAEAIAECEVHINEHMKQYAADDAGYLFDLYKAIKPKVIEEGLEHVIPVEMAVRLEAIDMEIHGMPVDRSKIEEIGGKLEAILGELEARVYDLAKQEFNINSSPQLKEIVFEQLKVTPPPLRIEKSYRGERHVPGFTKAGDKIIEELKAKSDKRLYSMDCRDRSSIPDELLPFLACDVYVLERIDHPIGQAVLDYRTAAKLLSAYVDSSLKTLDELGDGRLHGAFNPWGTVTFRFSSKTPNLQVLPSRGKSDQYHPAVQKIGPELRDAFVAPPPDDINPEGYCLLVTDHSQIELRVIADVSRDPNLIQVYSEYIDFEGMRFYTGDLHQKTSEEIGCKRKDAKQINFGFNYGMGPAKFARQNRIFHPDTTMYDLERCTTYRDGFFKAYRNIEKVMNHCGARFREGLRKFPTKAGRFRHFYNCDRIPGAKGIAKGQLLNSIIQGSAGDILKYVIYMIRKYVYPLYPGLQLIGQVHDEVIYVVPNKYKDEIGLLIKYCMEYPWYPLAVPILASAKLSDSWGAKDDDSIPEIGLFYAEIEGKGKIFDENNWHEFVEADDAGLVTKKAACGHLTPDQLEWCKSVIPDELPPKKPERKRNVITRKQMIAAGQR